MKALNKDDALLMIVGNKSDMHDQRQVSFKEAQKYALKKSLLYFETSAKTDQNIKALFNELA